MPFIHVNDISMYYEIHGQGVPLVLIGGFSADHTIWHTIVEQLAKSYKVIIFDNRGAGQTDVPDGAYSIEQMANDILGLCKKLEIEQAYFIGSSMGGYILQSLAYQNPTLVKKAVITNSAMVTHTCFLHFVKAQLELLKAEVAQVALIKSSCSWVYSYGYLSQPNVFDELVQIRLENPHPFTLTGFKAQLSATEIFDSRSWVNKISVPTLVIGSDQDLIFSESMIQALAKEIPNAEYHRVTGAGHLPHVEYPTEFIDVVMKFIKKI